MSRGVVDARPPGPTHLTTAGFLTDLAQARSDGILTVLHATADRKPHELAGG
jgi:hypothetical protein